MWKVRTLTNKNKVLRIIDIVLCIGNAEIYFRNP